MIHTTCLASFAYDLFLCWLYARPGDPDRPFADLPFGREARQSVAMNQDVRTATRHDLHAVETVIHAAYVHYVARIGRKPGPMLDDYGALIGNGQVHVVEHAGIVQGALVLIPKTGSMLLDNLAVSPEAQGLGLGRTLLQFAEHAALASGFRSIRLYTNEATTENIGLYSRIGYVETHRAQEKGLRRVYLVKALP